ncbi:hypothetical protein [Luteimonas salinilitoris]|uniref:Transposase n=1 Tax=Luteimonas salinilitoris TaxID=3237697 RepID=A0ABV4HPV3_9GAMM
MTINEKEGAMSAKTGYFWLAYDLNQTHRVVTSEEVFSKKHVHGIQPSEKQIRGKLPELRDNVRAKCEELGIAYPGDAVVDVEGEVCTRSAR